MKNGFTLIELLLYVSIIGVVILGASSYLSLLQHQSVRTRVIRETEEQALSAMQAMTQVIRNATAIQSPAAGNSASSSSVSVSSPSLSPTVFSLQSGAIFMQEGTASAVPLTTNRIIISGLTFSNLSATAPGTLRIQFTAAYNNPDGMPEYTYTKTSTASATLR